MGQESTIKTSYANLAAKKPHKLLKHCFRSACLPFCHKHGPNSDSFTRVENAGLIDSNPDPLDFPYARIIGVPVIDAHRFRVSLPRLASCDLVTPAVSELCARQQCYQNTLIVATLPVP